MASNKGVAATMFDALAKANINIKSIAQARPTSFKLWIYVICDFRKEGLLPHVIGALSHQQLVCCVAFPARGIHLQGYKRCVVSVYVAVGLVILTCPVSGSCTPHWVWMLAQLSEWWFFQSVAWPELFSLTWYQLYQAKSYPATHTSHALIKLQHKVSGKSCFSLGYQDLVCVAGQLWVQHYCAHKPRGFDQGFARGTWPFLPIYNHVIARACRGRIHRLDVFAAAARAAWRSESTLQYGYTSACDRIIQKDDSLRYWLDPRFVEGGTPPRQV